jgi:hypothetical protein
MRSIVGDWSQAAFSMPETVQSVVRCQDNGPLIAAAAQLWIKPDDIVLDVTYGQGRFWTTFRPEHLVTHDLAIDGVDFRHLPEPDASVDVVVFDPPYIQGSREGSTRREEFLDRYGLFEAPRKSSEVLELAAAGMTEAARVLRPKGRLFVKCMDYIDKRFVQGRHNVVATAHTLGLEQVDEFVHHSGIGPGAWERQLHSRRAHSFLCIFQKPAAARHPRHIDG